MKTKECNHYRCSDEDVIKYYKSICDQYEFWSKNPVILNNGLKVEIWVTTCAEFPKLNFDSSKYKKAICFSRSDKEIECQTDIDGCIWMYTERLSQITHDFDEIYKWLIRNSCKHDDAVIRKVCIIPHFQYQFSAVIFKKN